MKKIYNLIIFITIGIILLSAILIGSPLKNNVQIIHIAIAILMIGYILIKIKKKTPMITNKLDIFVIILMFSSAIPLIFNTYLSLEETINNLFTYLSMTSIYFIAKELTKNQKIKTITVILVGFILAGIIVFILGIDNLTINFFGKYLSKLGVLQYQNGEVRLIANLGYANTVGIIMAVCSFFAVGLYLNLKNKWWKNIIGSTNVLFLAGLLLSESKGSILLLGMIYIVYLISNKTAKNKANLIILTIETAAMAFIYNLLFSNYKENIVIIWISLILIYLVTLILLIILSKIATKRLQKILYKMDQKQAAFFIMMAIILLLLLLILALQFTRPLVLFERENEENQERQVIRNIRANTMYEIKFEIEAKTTENVSDVYSITIDEENKYDQKIASYELYLGSFEGEKTFNICTNTDTKRLTILFNNLKPENANGLTIKKLRINGNNIPVDYKYIPREMVSNLQSLTLANKNTWERGVFILDGIKLATQNWLTGIGGNGWENAYEEIQSYAYDARQSHCYFTQVWIENGILGLISLLFMIGLAIKIMLNNKKNPYTNLIGLSILLLLFHSMIDFDLSFFYTKLILFIELGMLSSYYYEPKTYHNAYKVISGIMLILLVIAIIENTKILWVQSNLKKVNEIGEIEKLAKILPYSLEVKEKKLQILKEADKKEEQVAVLEEIKRIEKSYSNLVLYRRISSIAIEQLEQGQTDSGNKNLEKAYQFLACEKGVRNLKIERYESVIKAISNCCDNLENLPNQEEFIQKQKQLLIEIVNDFNENIQEYSITRKSKEEYLEVKFELERYKKDAEEYLQK